jgi:glycine cleavage system H protein
MIMSKTYFTDEHEWIRVEGSTATVGITKYAQEQLGDLVFVELPKPVESVKAASDVYAPADGSVIEVNSAVASDPQLVNSAPESDGWLWKMSLSDPSQLDAMMDEAGYLKLVG